MTSQTRDDFGISDTAKEKAVDLWVYLTDSITDEAPKEALCECIHTDADVLKTGLGHEHQVGSLRLEICAFRRYTNGTPGGTPLVLSLFTCTILYTHCDILKDRWPGK